jgi:hypothetical protein
VLCLVNLFSMLSVSSPMALSSGVRVVHYLSFLCCVYLTCSPCCQCQFTHGFKHWGSCCTLFEFSVLCLVNLFSMLSVSSPMALGSGVRVVHYLSFLCCV